MPLTDFDLELYIILSNAVGKLDRLLEDTVYSIREIAFGTKDVNRYRYVEED